MQDSTFLRSASAGLDAHPGRRRPRHAVGRRRRSRNASPPCTTAVAAGITLLDLAPRYGDGKAEQVVGEAFGGRLPAGVRVTSKCNLGNPPPERSKRMLRQSIEASLQRLRLRGSICSSCIPMSCPTRHRPCRPRRRRPDDALRRPLSTVSGRCSSASWPKV